MRIFPLPLFGRHPIICMAVTIILMTGQAALSSHQAPAPAKKEDFPIYPALKPNVAFWIDMFTKYSRSHGVIHDSRNLDRIYTVIPLDPGHTSKAAKTNRKRKKAVLKEYKKILLNLSSGAEPTTTKEKEVADLFDNPRSKKVYQLAARNLRCQTGLSRQFREGIIRSGALIDEYKRIFSSYGLPTDLVYLPGVESAYNGAAYSKFGAAGIWQFTRGTGKRYMEINYVVDQRRDPFISAHGAAKLLKKNYQVLKEWPLAVTAYNHGLAGMKRAKYNKGGYENIFKTYSSRTFKFASRNFYSEFLAARQVLKNPYPYFGDITLDTPIPHIRLKTKGYLPALDLARGLGVNLKTIKKLNPSLRKPVFDGRKHIPSNFELSLPSHLDRESIIRVTTDLYKEKQKISRFHQVQKGDTAGQIARAHEVSLHDLIMANGLDSHAKIYTGQNLHIPVPDTRPPSPVKRTRLYKQTSTALPKSGSKSKGIIKTRTNLQTVTGNLKIKKTLKKGESLQGTIEVAPGETLGHYADWLGIPTQEIRSLNRLGFGRAISFGRKIKIPLVFTTPEQFEELRYEYHREIEEDFFDSFIVAGVETYEIKSGDSLWSLSRNELEIPLWLIQKYNPSTNFNSLKPSQKITYPIVSPNKKRSI